MVWHKYKLVRERDTFISTRDDNRMHRRLNAHIRTHELWLFALVVFALPTLSYSYESAKVKVAGGCLIRVWEDNSVAKKIKGSWTGKCDERGYATGDGTLYRQHRGRGVWDVFVGSMQWGEIGVGTIYENDDEYLSNYSCLPKLTSGQMTKTELNAWIKENFNSWQRAACRNDYRYVFVQEYRYEKGSNISKEYGEQVIYFGTDAERIADQTGVAEFAAHIRSRFTPTSQAPRKPPVKRDAPKRADDDACAKIQIINGKKLCEE